MDNPPGAKTAKNNWTGIGLKQTYSNLLNSFSDVWSHIQIFLTKYIWKKLYEFWILLYTSLIKIINWVCGSSWFLEYPYCFGIISLAISIRRILPKSGVRAKGRAKASYSQMPQHKFFNAMTVIRIPRKCENGAVDNKKNTEYFI